MNFKTTYILFGVLLVVLGVLAFALWYDPTARQNASLYVMPGLHDGDNKDQKSLKTDDITKVEIARTEPKETIVFERDPETNRWVITEPVKMRADSFAVNGLLDQLYNATRQEKVDEVPNLAAWGLQPPREVITVTRKDKKEFKLNLGKTNASGELYAFEPHNKTPMVVQKSRLSDALKSLAEFRDAELLASASGDLLSVSLAEGKDSIGWKKEGTHWFYTQPKDYGEAQNTFETPPPAGAVKVKVPGSMQTVLSDITNLKVERTEKGSDFVKDDVSDFLNYNLDPKKDKIFAITVTKREDAGKDSESNPKTKLVSRTLLVGLKPIDDKSGKYYARLKGENSIVKVTAKDVDPLRKLLDDKEALRDKVLVEMDGPPSAINIKNAYVKKAHDLIKLRRLPMPAGVPDTGHWMLWSDDTPQSVDPAVIRAQTSLVNLLRQKNPPLIDEFVDPVKTPTAEMGFDKDSEVVELWNDADGVKKEETKGKEPELKSKEPTYRLTFGKKTHLHDKELVYVKREAKRADGKYAETLVLIPLLAKEEAQKGPLTYLDKALPKFAAIVSPGWAGVTKLVIQRGKTTLEVARAKDDAPWKIVQPKGQADRLADKSKVETVLAAMNRLTALRLVENTKDEAVLAKYGLKSPQAKVEITMTKDGKPVTYTYDFGQESRPRSGELYARQSQRPMVFTVANSVVDTLPTDLLDLTVFTFDAAKVTKVKLTGWQNIVPNPVTLEFEKKDKTWEVVKGMPKDKFVAAKLTKLLDELHDCRAVSFEAFKSGPKPKYKLDAADGALVIEITVEKEKPITLTVGGPDGERGYYVMSNKSDGDVFLLPRSIFDELKSRPLYFKAEPK